MIENGRVTAPVRNVTLIGNGPDILSKVTMADSDYQFSDGRWTCGKAPISARRGRHADGAGFRHHSRRDRSCKIQVIANQS